MTRTTLQSARACLFVASLATSFAFARGARGDEPQPQAQPDTQPPPATGEVPPPPPPLAPEPAAPPPLAPVASPPPMVPALPPVFAGAEDQRRRGDLLLPLGVGTLALGGALTLAGAFTAAATQPEEYCTVTGCVDRPRPLEKNIMASLVGSGTGFLVVGAIGTLAGSFDSPKGDELRNDAPMMVAGYTATALAAASLGLGIAETLTYDDRSTDLSRAWPFFLTTTVLTSVGLPLLVIGAENEDAQERAQEARQEAWLRDPRNPKKKRSRGLLVGGGVVIGIGGLAAIAGTVAMSVEIAAEGEPGYVTALIAGPLFGVSSIMVAIGAPLLAVGVQRKKNEVPPKTAEIALPEVGVGPGGLSATWRLP